MCTLKNTLLSVEGLDLKKYMLNMSCFLSLISVYEEAFGSKDGTISEILVHYFLLLQIA